jgi:hypothetical protein
VAFSTPASSTKVEPRSSKKFHKNKEALPYEEQMNNLATTSWSKCIMTYRISIKVAMSHGRDSTRRIKQPVYSVMINHR